MSNRLRLKVEVLEDSGGVGSDGFEQYLTDVFHGHYDELEIDVDVVDQGEA